MYSVVIECIFKSPAFCNGKYYSFGDKVYSSFTLVADCFYSALDIAVSYASDEYSEADCRIISLIRLI